MKWTKCDRVTKGLAMQLIADLQDLFPSPSILFAYGLEQASKLAVITGVLRARNLKSSVVRSKDYLSQRHLLSKIFSTCVYALGREAQIEQYDKVDSLNVLLGNLRKLFEPVETGQKEQLVLILEDIDKLKQAGPTLLPALARLGDQIPGLSLILTSTTSQPLALHKTGVPYIHFPPYTRGEAIYLAASSPPMLFPDALPQHEGEATRIDKASLEKLYAQFIVTVYDSLIFSTSSTSIQTFRSTSERLWPRFIWPMVSGESPPGKAVSWDFAKLLVRNRGLFQTQGEHGLRDHLRPQGEAWSFEDLSRISREKDTSRAEVEPLSSIPNTPTKPRHRFTKSSVGGTPLGDNNKITLQHQPTKRQPPLLKHFPTLLLLSSYLASTTPLKHDILLFSRLSSNSSHISKKIRRLKNTPTRKKLKPTATSTTGTPSKSRIAKAILSASGGGGASTGVVKPFSVERLLAILRAVHPSGVSNTAGSRGVSDRVYHELGELERLRLVVRASAGAGASSAAAGGGASGAAAVDDATEEKWRVNVGRDWVVSMGKVWGLSVSEYEIEGDM
ncbi:hypothetical protein LTR84_010865 [Exophiala bonariae]|uniref:Orc1-like AAA ATPase domain-containing protein n=1 Tax=Exophiala bonariae TaxID=1690606 RepID=A0AAV9NIP1_9EURO|nr:hypothetical protein LTR84_010865 [Exophiala bonariae]